MFTQAIDLDQIVSEHYEKSCSQQTTQVTSRIGNTTPPSVQSKVRGAPEVVGKAESATFAHMLCAHGVEVGYFERFGQGVMQSLDPVFKRMQMILALSSIFSSSFSYKLKVFFNHKNT